jgi:hypothetical protein
MHRFLLLAILVPSLLLAQSKRKKLRIALEKEKQERIFLISNLKKHIEILASDSLEGRRTGTKGEMLAMEYLSSQYKTIGLEPANYSKYIQEFEFDEGKNYKEANTCLKVNENLLDAGEDYFPLAFSKVGSVKSNASAALKESGEVWICDLKDVLEENKTNPHFDIEEVIKKKANKASNDGAMALIIFNSSSIIDNLSFNKKDKAEATTIPVVYINYSAFKKYFKDIVTTNKIDFKIAFKEAKRRVHNVIGFINNNATNTVVLGAHYDHLGYGEDKNALDTFHSIHNGADDNASGSAALLELARLLKHSNYKNNNYLIIHFSGEELGLIGSKHWLEEPTINISKNYMINMDMVGRYDTAHKLNIGGFGTSPVWGEVLPTLSTSLITKFDSTGSGPSDHASFYRKDIPVLFFFTGSHSDYHKVSDDFEKINYDGEADIVKYIYSIVAATDEKGKLNFTKTVEPAMGKSSKFTVSLGVIPDYGFSGTGVKIDGVSGGKLAERIGLQAGDVLLQLGEYKFTDVISYMQTLGKFKKGDKTTLQIKRKDEVKEFEIIF